MSRREALKRAAEAESAEHPSTAPGSAQDDAAQDGVEELEPAYVQGTWNGLPMWTCTVCQWDTLEGEAVMLEHLRVQHLPPEPPAPEPPLVQVYDRWGNPV